MMMKCPDCGVPLDEIPFNRCRYHDAWREDEEEALRRKRADRPIAEKIRESESFEELRDHLAEWLGATT